MPLTSKGKEILSSMEKTYGSEEKAKQVLYASKNAGKVSGIDAYSQAGNPELTLTDLQEQNRKFWEQGAAKGDVVDEIHEVPGELSLNLPSNYPTGPPGTENPASLGGEKAFGLDDGEDIMVHDPSGFQVTGDDNEEAIEESIHPGLHQQVEQLKTAGKHAEKTEYEPAKDLAIPTTRQSRGGAEVSRTAASREYPSESKPSVSGALRHVAGEVASRLVPALSDAEDDIQSFATGHESHRFVAKNAGGPVGTKVAGQKVVYGNEAIHESKVIHGGRGMKVAPHTPGPSDQSMHPSASLAQRAKGTVAREEHNLRDSKDFVAQPGEINLGAQPSDKK